MPPIPPRRGALIIQGVGIVSPSGFRAPADRIFGLFLAEIRRRQDSDEFGNC